MKRINDWRKFNESFISEIPSQNSPNIHTTMVDYRIFEGVEDEIFNFIINVSDTSGGTSSVGGTFNGSTAGVSTTNEIELKNYVKKLVAKAREIVAPGVSFESVKIIHLLYKLCNENNIDERIKMACDLYKEYDGVKNKLGGKKLNIKEKVLYFGDTEINDFLKFSSYIHERRPNQNIVSEISPEDKKSVTPLYSSGNIDVYEGDSPEKTSYLLKGGLTGKTYSFCIKDPGYWKSYRDRHDSTFYIMYDKNKNLDDPLHIILYDVRKNGIVIVDERNRESKPPKGYGSIKSYQEYLKSKGIPVEKFVNVPKTDQEKYEDELFKSKIEDLEVFKNLDNPKRKGYRKPILKNGEEPDPDYYKSAYIGRRFQLTDKQFDWLMGEFINETFNISFRYNRG